ERRAFSFPAVRLFALMSSNDLLFEEAVFVIDAVAKSRHAERSQRFKETCRQPAQPTVAQSRVRLNFKHVLKVDIELCQHSLAFFHQAEIAEVIAEPAPHKKFHGEIVEALR